LNKHIPFPFLRMFDCQPGLISVIDGYFISESCFVLGSSQFAA
jgi:hypothetical protein